MIKVNLLPSKIVQQRRRRDFIVFVGICAVFAVAICYFFYLSLSQTIYPLENKLQELDNKIAHYQPVLKKIQQVNEKNSKLQARFSAFKKVVAEQSLWPQLLYDVYRSLPETIWLEEIKADEGKNFIEVRGRSLNETIGVANFIKNMEKYELFSDIKFTKFSRQEVFGREVMSFELKCFLPEG